MILDDQRPLIPKWPREIFEYGHGKGSQYVSGVGVHWYVDDLGLTGKNKDEVRNRTEEADRILKHANMKVKSWVFSGDSRSVEIGDISEALPLDEVGSERMLGVTWEPRDDAFKFSVRINLSTLKK